MSVWFVASQYAPAMLYGAVVTVTTSFISGASRNGRNLQTLLCREQRKTVGDVLHARTCLSNFLISIDASVVIEY
jgi:hypothetical protein